MVGEVAGGGHGSALACSKLVERSKRLCERDAHNLNKKQTARKRALYRRT
jgi:hypothetical protein